MAYVYPHQRRTVPAPFFYDLRPATPPIVPVAVITPYFLQSVPHQIEFVVPNPPVLRPLGFTFNHAAIIQMDEQRTQALIQFISKEGLVPSPEEESKRKNAIDQLKQLEEVQGFCDPNPTEYIDHKEPQPNTVFYWGLSSIKSSFIDIRSVREDFMRSVENGYQGSSGCRLELSIIGSSQLPKDAQSEAGIGKGSRAFWRNPNYNDRRKPIYSQHLPGYFVGYVAGDQDGYPSSAG